MYRQFVSLLKTVLPVIHNQYLCTRNLSVFKIRIIIELSLPMNGHYAFHLKSVMLVNEVAI